MKFDSFESGYQSFMFDMDVKEIRRQRQEELKKIAEARKHIYEQTIELTKAEKRAAKLAEMSEQLDESHKIWADEVQKNPDIIRQHAPKDLIQREEFKLKFPKVLVRKLQPHKDLLTERVKRRVTRWQKLQKFLKTIFKKSWR